MLIRLSMVLLASWTLITPPSYAQDAMWLGNTGDWNTANNWSPVGQPMGTAIFDASGQIKAITFSQATTSIGALQFNAAASDYIFTINAGTTPQSLVIDGAGITSSARAPTINVSGGFLGAVGTLEFAGSSGAGIAVINNLGDATVVFRNNSSAQSATISVGTVGNLNFMDSASAGNATITISGPAFEEGHATFYNSSTAGNARITTSGPESVLIFRDSSTAGNALITSLNFSGVSFYDTSTAGNASISGSASEIVTIPPVGPVISGPTNGIVFHDSSTAGNATLGTSFIISFIDSSSAGSASILNDLGGLVFGDYSTADLATITTTTSGYRTFFIGNSNGGQARFINAGDGAIDFSGTSGPDGDHKITAGSIEGTGTVYLGANQLTLGGNNLSTTFAGQIVDGGGGGGSGSGASLVKVGTGTLTLSGTNTYSGGTTISGGVLQFAQPGSIAGAGANVLVNAGGTAAAGYPIYQAFIARIASSSQGVLALAADSSNNLDLGAAGLVGVSLGAIGSVTYSGTLTAAGSTFRLGGGSGTLTMTSTLAGAPNLLIGGTGLPGVVTLNAASAYIGSTEVAGGTLLIGDASAPNASISGPVTVNGGATLGGHGTIFGNVVSNGMVRPGASVGVLTVAGNYTQSSVGSLTIEITPNATAGAGIGYDQLRVTGTANLAGRLGIAVDPGTYAIGSRYTIVTAVAGRSGTFDSVSFGQGLGSYITPVVSYDASDVYLDLDPAPSVANSLRQIPDMLTALVSAGEGIADAVLGDVCGPAEQRIVAPGQGCVVRALATGYQSEVWMRGIGGLGRLTGGDSNPSFSDAYGGVVIGAGVGTNGFTVGLGGGYLATTMNFSGGSSASQNAGVGFVYGRYDKGPWSLGAVAAYSGGQIDGARVVPAAGMSANGNRSGDLTVIEARSAYRFAIGSMTIQPRVNVWYIHAGEGGFSETGASLIDFAFSGARVDTTGGELALRATRQFWVAGWTLTPWMEAGMQQTFSGLSRNVLASAGSFTASVSAISPAPTAAVVGSGLNASVREDLDLFIAYTGQFSANQAGNAFSAGLTWRF